MIHFRFSEFTPGPIRPVVSLVNRSEPKLDRGYICQFTIHTFTYSPIRRIRGSRYDRGKGGVLVNCESEWLEASGQ